LVVGAGFTFQDFAAGVDVGDLGQATDFIVVAGGGDAVGMSERGDSAVGPAGVGVTGVVGVKTGHGLSVDDLNEFATGVVNRKYNYLPGN
jgi:hypothetical protein